LAAAELAALKGAAKSEGVRADAPLVVLVRSAENAILPARARAELVAALAVVDYVCDAEEESVAFEPGVRLEDAHRQRLKELIAHVHARQQSAAADPPGNAPRQDS